MKPDFFLVIISVLVEIQLSPKYYPGKKIVIEANNNSNQNQYLQSIKINGNTSKTVFIPFTSIIKGGLLSLELGATPNQLLVN